MFDAIIWDTNYISQVVIVSPCAFKAGLQFCEGWFTIALRTRFNQIFALDRNLGKTSSQSKTNKPLYIEERKKRKKKEGENELNIIGQRVKW